jgi:hypothetical protein
MEERRKDMDHMMTALRDQNNILAAQNVLLKEIIAFITPVSAFFAAFKNFVIFMAWIVGAIGAGYAVWQGFVNWIKAH